MKLAKFLLMTIVLSSCGGKPVVESKIVHSFIQNPFYDVNNVPSLDLNSLKDLPQSVDLKEIMTTVKDQSDRGTCSFFASIGIFEAAIKKKMNVELNLSEEYLNTVIKKLGFSSKDEGGYPEDNLKYSIENHAGLLLEKDWKYQPTWFTPEGICRDYKTSDRAAPKACFSHFLPPENILKKRITTDHFVSNTMEPKSINEVITFLATKKLPLTVGLPVYEKGWKDNGQISYTEEMRNECIKDSSLCGFHAVIITGYDLEKKIFTIKNSWGSKWGSAGYGTIPIDVVDLHADRSFTWVELEKDLDLPLELNEPELKLNKFDVAINFYGANTIPVKASWKIDNLNGSIIKISSTVVQKNKDSNELPNYKNTQIIELAEKELSSAGLNFVNERKTYYPFDSGNISLLSDTRETQLNIAKSDLNLKTIVKALNNDKDNVYLRTTIFEFNDIDGYKNLKSDFQLIQ